MTTAITSFSGEYRFLSNFYPSTIFHVGKTYISNEHFFQAFKATSEHDHEKVRTCSSPGEAKKIARSIDLRPDWESVKLDVMLLGLRLKFTQNYELRKRLLATGDAHLEEGNTWGDTVWGTVNGQGQNLLGKDLMYIRDEMKKLEQIQNLEFNRGFNDYFY